MKFLDIVALRFERFGLPPGTSGTIVEIVGAWGDLPGAIVEFTDGRGTTLGVHGVPLSELRLVLEYQSGLKTKPHQRTPSGRQTRKGRT